MDTTQAAGACAHSTSEDERASSAPANPPPSNTGGIQVKRQDVWEDSEELVSDGQDIWLKCKQRQSEGVVFVDWLSFTVRSKEDQIKPIAGQLAERLSKLLASSIHEGRGAHYYESSFRIVSNETLLAVVYYGGPHQRNTVHVSLPGSAWLSSDQSLNRHVYDLMVEFGVERISRIDLARDCFDNEASFESMKQAYCDGHFKPSRGVSPSMWLIEDKRRGSTCHVGRRENGKLIRGYEKSMQLARQQGWFRVELELRSVNRRIPVEAILNPASHFAGACKFLAYLADTARTERVATFRKTAELSLEHITHYAKLAYGKLVRFLSDAGVTADQIVHDLTHGVEGMPRRLRIAPHRNLLNAVALAPATNTALFGAS
ncbi:MAG: replication initiation factor domain-containing protein [Aquabacterium sp.]